MVQAGENKYHHNSSTNNLPAALACPPNEHIHDSHVCHVLQTVLGIILGGGAGSRLYPLTKKRAKPAVPLGANYRLIDIPVSNCINSSITKIYTLTQFNSASLNRHLSQAYVSDMVVHGMMAWREHPRLQNVHGSTWIKAITVLLWGGRACHAITQPIRMHIKWTPVCLCAWRHPGGNMVVCNVYCAAHDQAVIAAVSGGRMYSFNSGAGR